MSLSVHENQYLMTATVHYSVTQMRGCT